MERHYMTPITGKKRSQNTDIQIIELDTTYGWSDKIKAQVDKIFTVYLYDESVTTNCAELIPSYELTPLYFNVTYKPEQKRNEDLEETIDNEFVNEEPIYMHCSDVKKLQPADLSRLKNINKRFVGRKSRAYYRHIEEISNYFKSNHII